LWRQYLENVSVWLYLEDTNSDWRQLEGTPERKIKGRFDELSKVRALKRYSDGWIGS
jgi:16S rRNA (cytosine967-C5)-methyltransferase